MKISEKSQIAWQVWNLLNDISNLLWNLYEDDFFLFCFEDDICQSLNDHEDEWILGSESAIDATQNKNEE